MKLFSSKQTFVLLLLSLFSIKSFSFRDNPDSQTLSPYTAIMAQLTKEMRDFTERTERHTSESRNIHAFDSNYTGGIALQNTGGAYHTDPSVPYWNYSLIINEDNYPVTDQEGTTEDTTAATQFNKALFKLQQNIVFKPSQSYFSDQLANNDYGVVAAIIIDRDNVTIDLSGFTLSFSDTFLDESSSISCPVAQPEELAAIHGIYIVPGRTNVNIISNAGVGVMNSGLGTISGFPGNSIKVSKTGIINSIVENVTCKNLFLTKNYNGISIHNAVHTTFENVYVHKNSCPENFYGMYVNNGDTITLKNFGTDTNSCCTNMHGLYFENGCTNIEIENYECSLNTTSSGTFHGISLIDSNNLYLSKCLINSNSASGNVKGIYSSSSFDTTIKHSEINANSSTLSGSAHGIELSAGFRHILDNITITENISSEAEATFATGIFINNESTRNEIKNCNIIYNHSNSAVEPLPTSYGIRVEGSELNQIINNQIGKHESYGIIDVADSENTQWASSNIYHRNYAFYNVSKADTNNQQKNNYYVFYKESFIDILFPLETIVLYTGDSSPHNTAQDLANIEVKVAG